MSFFKIKYSVSLICKVSTDLFKIPNFDCFLGKKKVKMPSPDSYKKVPTAEKLESGREKIHPDDLDRETDKKEGCRDVLFAIIFIMQM